MARCVDCYSAAQLSRRQRTSRFVPGSECTDGVRDEKLEGVEATVTGAKSKGMSRQFWTFMANSVWCIFCCREETSGFPRFALSDTVRNRVIHAARANRGCAELYSGSAPTYMR